MSVATLDHTFDGHAYRIGAGGVVPMERRSEIVSGAFRILDNNNTGIAGVVIGNGERPETFWLVPASECQKLVGACPECGEEPSLYEGRCGRCRAESMR